MCIPLNPWPMTHGYAKAQREEMQARTEAQAEAIRRHNAALNDQEAMARAYHARPQPQEAPDVEDAEWRELPNPQLPAT